MKRTHKFLKTLIISTVLTLTVGIGTAYGATGYSPSDYKIGWNHSAGKPTFNMPGSIYTRIADSTGSTIMSRLRDSYTLDYRMPKIQSLTSRQEYVAVYGTSTGNTLDYAGMTSVHGSDPWTGIHGYTAWYDSPYAIFLDYLNPYNNRTKSEWPSYATQYFESAPNGLVQDSIDYAKALVKSGAVQSDAAYIAITGVNGGLGDAKTASIIARNSDMRYPILLDDQDNSDMYDNNLDTAVKNALVSMDIHNLYILGGVARFTSTAGLGKGYNLVRAGGLNRQETQILYEKLPTETKTLAELTKLKASNPGSIIVSGPAVDDGRVPAWKVADIKAELNKELVKKDTANIVACANNILDRLKLEQTITKTSKPLLTIGINTTEYEAYWVCYDNVPGVHFVYQFILDDYFAENKLVIEHRDASSGNLIRANTVEKIGFSTVGSTVNVTRSAPAVSNYTYTSSKVVSNGATTVNTNPATVKCYQTGTNKIIFYYTLSPPAVPSGSITFTPTTTEWVNTGKTAESTGAYPVVVKYTGSSSVSSLGQIYVTYNDSYGVATSYVQQFPVTFSYKSTAVTGAYAGTVTGVTGTIKIPKQGENLKLSGTGSWNAASYTTPAVPSGHSIYKTVIPTAPKAPTGNSGDYDLDWTKPAYTVTPPLTTWIKSPSPYVVTTKIDDTLSGIATGDFKIDDTSHYARDSSSTFNASNAKTYSFNTNLADGIYTLSSTSADRAKNVSSWFGTTYYIDGTQPTQSFNVTNQIFGKDANSIRKASAKGTRDGFFGKLTFGDNLSGVKSVDYGWTFAVNTPTTFTNVYSSPITYTDRYAEVLTAEIEKPVGDNLYLQVKVTDCAGNVSTKSYGPFEDPIKLKEYNINDVRDPNWNDEFREEDGSNTGSAFYVDSMPIGVGNNSKYPNASIKKGYAFYFNLTTEYMYRQRDTITITPTYWYLDSANQAVQLDMYYAMGLDSMVKTGSVKDTQKFHLTHSGMQYLIGNLSKLTLTKDVRTASGREWIGGWYPNNPSDVQYSDGKIQYWYGKYMIPATAKFVEKDKMPYPSNVVKVEEIIVRFDIDGSKLGSETNSLDQTFDYLDNQWTKEGGPKDPTYKPGDTIIYDNKKSLLDDLDTRVTN